MLAAKDVDSNGAIKVYLISVPMFSSICPLTCQQSHAKDWSRMVLFVCLHWHLIAGPNCTSQIEWINDSDNLGNGI